MWLSFTPRKPAIHVPQVFDFKKGEDGEVHVARLSSGCSMLTATLRGSRSIGLKPIPCIESVNNVGRQKFYY